MLEHVDISHLSGYNTPSKARYFMEYTGDNIDELREASQFAYSNNLSILTIAGGRNSLLAFDEYPGLVIHNSSKSYELKNQNRAPLSRGTKSEGISLRERHEAGGFVFESETPRSSTTPLDRGATGTKNSIILTADAGYPIWELAEKLEKDHDIHIWHRFLGLPGSIGGAVYGNAGCFGLDIGPYVVNVDIFDMQTGVRFSKSGQELDFKYRWSECKNHPEWFILSVTCDLSQMIEKYPAPEEDPLAWRARVQPEGLSCGSFFKNPNRENSAGSLLEKVGLKGYRHGGAYFSDKHANFLISDGTARWTDLVELVEIAQQKVLEETGISLEPEVRIVREKK